MTVHHHSRAKHEAVIAHPIRQAADLDRERRRCFADVMHTGKPTHKPPCILPIRQFGGDSVPDHRRQPLVPQEACHTASVRQMPPQRQRLY